MATSSAQQHSSQLPIIVVGAGTAGLSCAKALHAAGKHVFVLEAQSRIGGRIHSETHGDEVFDLGASWIHGINNNPIWEITQQHQIATTVFNYLESDFYHVGGRAFSAAEQQAFLHYIERIEQALLKQTEASALHAIQAILNDLDAPDSSLSKTQLDQLALIFFERLANDPFATSLAELSTHFAEYEGYFEGDEVIFPAGYAQVIDVLAQGLDIQTDIQIKQIIRHAEHVELIDQHGQSYLASQVVVATALGVLKNQDIQFSPALPHDVQQAIENFGFGSFNKVFLQFEQPLPFQHHQSNNSIFYFHNNICYSILDLSQVYQKPVYLMLFGGPQSEWIDQATDQEVWHLIHQSLTDNFTDIPEHAKHMIITRWGSDAFTHGSFSFPLPQHSAQIGLAFHQAINQQIYFAGEHCEQRFAGTAHGAYLSGQQTAERVLRDHSSP